MNILKKTLGIILAAVILTSVFVTAASAADTTAITSSASSDAVSGYAGKDCKWSYNNKTGVLTISGSGQMYDFNDQVDDPTDPEPRPWNKYNSKIKSVVIENGVEGIGYFSFLDCVNLETVQLPDTLTYIGYDAFCGCSNLKSINIPESVTVIDFGAFLNCASLESISIPSGIKELSYAFYGCESLNSVYITDLEAWKNIKFDCKEANPLYYAHMLYLNNELVTEVSFKEGTEKIGKFVFDGAECIKKITIPDSVKNVGQYAFTNTGYFKDINNWENGALYLNKCLYRAKKDTEGNVSIKDGTTVIAEYAFDKCKSINELAIPASVKYVGADAFVNSAIPSVSITDLKAWCEIDFDGFGYGSNPICGIKNFYLNGELVENLVTPEGITELKDYAFYGYEGLKALKVSDGVTRIGYNTFSFIDSLESIDIPASVNVIDGSFEECKNLKKINISDIGAWCKVEFGDQYSNPLYDMHNLYLNNKLITDLVIPEGTKIINDDVFAGCSNIKSVTIPESVTEIRDCTFTECTNMKTITLPSNLDKIGYGAFMKCSSLESIHIPEGIKEIETETFSRCKSLKKVTFPSTLTIIGGYAFYKCSSLESAKLPEGLKTIKGDAFSDCKKLTVTLPKSLKDVSYGAFDSCKKVNNKLNNTMKVTVKKKTIKISAKDLRKKKVTINLLRINDYREDVKVSKVKKGTSKKIYKKVKIKTEFWTVGDSRSSLTLSKGYYKKGTYKAKIKVTAYDKYTNAFKDKTKTVTVKIKIK